jgi:hypothetical protein
MIAGLATSKNWKKKNHVYDVTSLGIIPKKD